MSLLLRHLLPAAALTIVFSALFPAFARTPDSLSKTVEELTLRADSGDLKSIYSLASLYERGYDSIAPDSIKSLSLYRRAAEAGMPEAQNYLGYLFYKGGMVKADTDSAVFWISQAALNGDMRAANNLGYMFMEGERIEHDDAKAAYWFEIAAEGGISSAITQLADLTAEGRGVERDSLRAEELYLTALDRGFSDAAHKLWRLKGKYYSSLPDDDMMPIALRLYTHGAPQYAVVLFNILADRGDARAEALLGDAHSRALGADYDYNSSLLHFFRAAKGGNPSAAFFIAETLEFFPDALSDFEAVTDEDTSPAKWYDAAAAAGVTDAASALRLLLNP